MLTNNFIKLLIKPKTQNTTDSKSATPGNLLFHFVPQDGVVATRPEAEVFLAVICFT